MTILHRIFKIERRKDLELRKIIDESEQEAEEFRKTAEKLIATIDGDPDWIRKLHIEN